MKLEIWTYWSVPFWIWPNSKLVETNWWIWKIGWSVPINFWKVIVWTCFLMQASFPTSKPLKKHIRNTTISALSKIKITCRIWIGNWRESVINKRKHFSNSVRSAEAIQYIINRMELKKETWTAEFPLSNLLWYEQYYNQRFQKLSMLRLSKIISIIFIKCKNPQ